MRDPLDRMRDPLLAQLMFLIEEMICAADGEAKAEGIILKDSQVQSALTKARGLVAGRSPTIPEGSGADRILHALILRISRAPRNLIEREDGDSGGRRERPIAPSDCIMAIEAVIASVKNRRSGTPGSRDYLDFVHDFVRRTRDKIEARKSVE